MEDILISTQPKALLDQVDSNSALNISHQLNHILAGLFLRTKLVAKYISLQKQLQIVTKACNDDVKYIEKNNQQIIVKPAINTIPFINKFFEEINNKLDNNGVFIGFVETAEMRKIRIIRKYSFIAGYIIHVFDFIFHRVFPKMGKITRSFYFFITKGKCRVMPKAEILGRLYACGFKVLEFGEEAGKFTFVAQKIKTPDYNLHPSYGIFFKMKRVGKNGKDIFVFKMRTMYAYSEYLQGYLNDTNGLAEGGKFKNDFRVSSYGRVLRKCWIDELPMIINFIRGDLKLVGVRPISRHYFNLLTEELQQLRIKHTPGLIPPFYVDLPKTLVEIMESEKKYLLAYSVAPIKTDITYFKQAMINIFIKRVRSN